jgi:dynein heavy chain, axonemal
LQLFEVPQSRFPELGACGGQLRGLKTLWDFKALVLGAYDAWKGVPWAAIDTEALEDANKRIAGELKRTGDAHPTVKAWGAYRDVEALVRDMAVTLPLVAELHSPAMRPRHWAELAVVCGVRALDPGDPKFALEDLLALRLHEHAERVADVVDAASKEQKIERKLEEIEAAWRAATLEFVPHKDGADGGGGAGAGGSGGSGGVRVVRASDDVLENLDAHALELQAMLGQGRAVDFFRGRVEAAQRSLGAVEEVLREWLGVTKAWGSLEAIFLGSADIRAQLPDDTKRFEGIDAGFKELMRSATETPNVVDACMREGRGEALRDMGRALELCQKSLNEYLDTKKKVFPRFYFVSNVALLDILSHGANPPRVMPYIGDSFEFGDLVFDPPLDAPPGGAAASGAVRNTATAMVAKDGEVVPFHRPFVMTGPVERWLGDLCVMQQDSLRAVLEAAIEAGVNWEVEKPRHVWLEDYPAQIALVGSQIYWTEETQAALDELEAGTEDSLKKYLAVCNNRLNALIGRVLGDLAPDLRTKVISLITLDVHARDVVQRLIDSKAEGPGSFLWSQQLRFYWAPETRDVNIAITDFRSKYSYEYLGNTGRLVITPLTDRCYITLTMALRLYAGGAPAGPAGTGKTETTKDLARCVGGRADGRLRGVGCGELLAAWI